MFVFGVAITDREVYDRVARVGIERAAEPDSVVLTRTGDSIQGAYNSMMEEAAKLPGLEALVLMHQDLKLTDGSLPERMRSAFRDPSVSLVGPLGGWSAKLHRWLSADGTVGTVN